MIEVLYQDAYLIIVHKPHDVLSVPGKGPDKQDSLDRRLHRQGFHTARIVHRLDYATSGIMILALDADTHRQLSTLFQERLIEKDYQALLSGVVEHDSGTIDQPLRCDWERRPLQIIDHEHGKRAITHYSVIERSTESTRVMLSPQTGRSHQLRVHMQYLGNPICGDRFYAHPEALAQSPVLCLHAQRLRFTHPVNGQLIDIEKACSF